MIVGPDTVLFQQLQRISAVLHRNLFYWFQRFTGWGINAALEQELMARARLFLANGGRRGRCQVPHRSTESIVLADRRRYRLVRDDIYQRFVVLESGYATDEFGRTGKWVPRGCQIYYDRDEDLYIKFFDKFFCEKGEGKFLPVALNKGVYDFLCPALAYVIKDAEQDLRGYAIRAGNVLTPYEFERYVEVGLREAICEITTQSGLYFYDLIYHNVIRIDDEISLIDLESVLPINWYGQDERFSIYMLQQIDIGYPIQKKFLSPDWYAAHIEKLQTK